MSDLLEALERENARKENLNLIVQKSALGGDTAIVALTYLNAHVSDRIVDFVYRTAIKVSLYDEDAIFTEEEKAKLQKVYDEMGGDPNGIQ